MADKKREKLIQESVNEIGKIVGKIIKGKGNNESVNKLVGEIIRYNVYNSISDYNPHLPTIVIKRDKNEPDTKGSYSKEMDSLWINQDYYDISVLQKHPAMIVSLFDTVSHEIRHWYQYNETYNKVQDNNIKDLIMSGGDDVLFQNAVNNLQQMETFNMAEIEEMYRFVSDEQVLEDFKILATDTADINTGLGVANDFGRYQEAIKKNMKDIKGFFANVIDFAQYASKAKELDARIAGAVGAINLVGELRQNKNKNVKNWSSNISITKLIDMANFTELGDDNQFGNDDLRDGYENYLKHVSSERIVQMMAGIQSKELFKKFTDNILNQKSDSEIEKIMISALTKPEMNFEVSPYFKEYYSNLPPERIKEIFSSGVVLDLNGNTARITPAAYSKLISLTNVEFSFEDRLKKAQEFVEEGRIDYIAGLNDASSWESFDFVSSLQPALEQNKEKVFETLQSKNYTERQMNNLLGVFVTKHFPEINEIRLNHLTEKQERISNISNDMGRNQTMKDLLLEYIEIQEQTQNSIDKLKGGEESYFKLAAKFDEIISSMVDAKINAFTPNLMEIYNKKMQEHEENDTFKKNCERVGEIYDIVFPKNNFKSEFEFILDVKRVFECCKARNEKIKELLSQKETAEEKETSGEEKENDEVAKENELEERENVTNENSTPGEEKQANNDIVKEEHLNDEHEEGEKDDDYESDM